MLADGSLLVRAPAKLNLSLRIKGIREDGYHELDSIVAKVSLYDDLVLTRQAGGLELVCDCPSAGPADKNLALRAARGLQEHAGKGAGARIELRKRIAVGAGLGGGSSDAAAVLTGLNQLWGTGLSRQDLSLLGLQLGSDVPLFLAGPASRMRGCGELLTPVSLRPFWAILVCPPVHCSTAEVYAAYDAAGGQSAEPIDPAWLSQRPVEEWPAFLENDLYRPACQVCPSILGWAERLGQSVGANVLMTGSGSASFAIMPDFTTAQNSHKSLPNELKNHAHVVKLNDW